MIEQVVVLGSNPCLDSIKGTLRIQEKALTAYYSIMANGILFLIQMYNEIFLYWHPFRVYLKFFLSIKYTFQA